jgi:hypothetical protein
MGTLRFDNPFHDLWVTEILDPWAYVRMFSPILVSDSEELFSHGNVVLKGRQGSGKSMLLNLLATSTRVAYARSQTKYPVPQRQRCFISAGVQLTRESASLVAARSAELPESQRASIVAINFADYLNVLLCLDLLRNVLSLSLEQSKDRSILQEVPVNLSEVSQRALFSLLHKREGWAGLIDRSCNTFSKAIESLEDRLRAHKNYFNFNIDALPVSIETTRSPAGVPMAELASALREAKILPEETLVLLRIDQHEELFELERHTGLGHVFRQVINSALARRDPRVAYRIGTRHYAWTVDLAAWGSGAPLEELRDYSVVDLDSILRRGEHTKKWKFPSLAKDVLAKRLEGAGFQVDSNTMEVLFGRSMEPAEKARRYVGDAASLVRPEASWAPEWKSYLDELWNKGEPLEARFGSAWLRQTIQKRRNIAQSGEQATGLPWRKSPWWVKERNEIALMQLAGERSQALIWSGERQIVDLAGHNILAFMTICKSIWATWQRRNPADADKRSALPRFSTDDQAIGVTEASQIWFKKIQVGLEADQRARLITALGGWFRRRMLDDQALSNPGHSGFSLLDSDLMSDELIVSIIKACRDHGDLLESSHTTKHRDQAPRKKWYLHPLLCPLFRIPHIRTKEPIYSTPNEILALYLDRDRASRSRESVSPVSSTQLGLPGF